MKMGMKFNWSKKAQESIGSGITWFFALFVIIFIMILFILAAMAFAGIGFFSGNNEIKVYSGSSSGVDIQNNFYFLMNQKVDIDGIELKVKDLVKLDKDATPERYERFKHEVEGFMDEYLMEKNDKDKGNIDSAWVRVYPFDSQVSEWPAAEYLNIYRGTETYNSLFSGSLYYTCNPKTENSMYTKVIIPKNKIIALCVAYKNE